MRDISTTKEITKLSTLGIPMEMKNVISIPIAFIVDIFIRNKSITSVEHKTKNRQNYLVSTVSYKPTKWEG